jgi:hypothetical protein
VLFAGPNKKSVDEKSRGCWAARFVPVGLLPIIPPSYGSLAAGSRLRLPLGQVGAERLAQAMTAGLGLACRFRVVSLSSGHGQVYTGSALAGEM